VIHSRFELVVRKGQPRFGYESSIDGKKYTFEEENGTTRSLLIQIETDVQEG
jgi:hypothetical protein